MSILSIFLSILFGTSITDTLPMPVRVSQTAEGLRVVTGYKPDMFLDSARVTRIKAVFPVIRSMYEKYAAGHQIPGIAFGLVSGGKLIYADAIGIGNTEKNIHVSSRSVYRIASMTKSFAAMAILKLRDAGKLSLDDPISKFIPEYDSVALLTSDSPEPTIHNLLTHTAGFPEDNPWGDRQLERKDQELIDFLKKGVSLSNIPGMEYEYSNLGFALIGVIITKASGEHYEKYIRENIFVPLGMKSTYWEYDEVPDTLLVQGYRVVNGKWVRQPMLHSGAYGVMGGLLTSIEDFSKYINLHLSAWPARNGGDALVLKRSSIREMHLPGKISSLNVNAKNGAGETCPVISSYNFGLGWNQDCTGKRRIAHSGGLPGFGSQWAILPDYDLGIVSFCNLTYAATSGLNNRLLDTIIKLAGLEPRVIPGSNILEERKGQLVKLLPDWREAEASGIFAENFFLDYFTDSLRKESAELFARAGKIRKIGEMMPLNQLRGSFILEGTSTNIEVWFTLSPENPAKIQAFEIDEISKPASSFLKYKLKTVSDVETYQKQITENPQDELVALDQFIPGIKLDIRYATSNNIMKEPVYDTAAAFLRRPAAEALKKVQAELNKLGYGLKIYDGYRPYDVTVRFYEAFHDTIFVASPYSGSRHNRGCAVDLTVIDLKTGKELAMPTPYDSFSDRSYADYPNLSKKVLKNRALFQKVMTENGFDIYPSEWWHYDFKEWRKYPVLDIPFKRLP